jgi:hypothetical protein
MTEQISSNAIIYAILALDAEAVSQQSYLESGEVPDDEREIEEETLADLQQAFMEFIEVYKQRCRADSSLPSLDELLTNPL